MSDLETTLKDLPRLLREREEDLEERERELRRLKERLEKEHPSLGKPSDVLRLNVAGIELIYVLRRTLTQGLEGSLLESMFSGRWDDSLEKDEDGRFFVDQQADLFVCLVNYLRNKQNETPLSKRTKSPNPSDIFVAMCEYYGVTFAVYPVALYAFDFKKYKEDNSFSSWNLITEFEKQIHHVAEIETTYWIQAVVGCHSRNVVAFEVVLDECSHALIGWFQTEEMSNHKDAKDEWSGNGFGPYSVALDCKQCGTVNYEKQELHSLGSAAVSLKQGSHIRAEMTGKEATWYVDGKKIASEKVAFDIRDTDSSYSTKHKRPNWKACLSIEGSFTITKVELEF